MFPEIQLQLEIYAIRKKCEGRIYKQFCSKSDIDEDCSEKMTFDSVQNSNRNCGSLIFKGVGLLQDDEVVWNSTKRWQTMGIAHSEFKYKYYSDGDNTQVKVECGTRPITIVPLADIQQGLTLKHNEGSLIGCNAHLILTLAPNLIPEVKLFDFGLCISWKCISSASSPEMQVYSGPVVHTRPDDISPAILQQSMDLWRETTLAACID
uniref:Uncharacterized protein n=1 Tax=Megaselia scalaris TaxID=36166 RepID=T1GPG7_MEGSC